MTTKAPRHGSGKCQWHTGAWVGTLWGSTLWLLRSAGRMAGHAPLLGGILLGGFLVPNVAGVVLWRPRDRVPPSVAIQCVLGLIGVCGFEALVAMQRAGQLLALDPRFASPVVYDGMRPMGLGIMGWLWVVGRAAITQRSGGPECMAPADAATAGWHGRQAGARVAASPSRSEAGHTPERAGHCGQGGGGPSDGVSPFWNRVRQARLARSARSAVGWAVEAAACASPAPNKGVQATAASVRSCLAPAVRRA